MGVDVDEAGCDDFAGRVDHGVGPVDLETLSRVDSDDAPVVDGDIGASFGGAGAVDDATVTNESVDVQESPSPGSLREPTAPPRGPRGERLVAGQMFDDLLSVEAAVLDEDLVGLASGDDTAGEIDA